MPHDVHAATEGSGPVFPAAHAVYQCNVNWWHTDRQQCTKQRPKVHQSKRPGQWSHQSDADYRQLPVWRPMWHSSTVYTEAPYNRPHCRPIILCSLNLRDFSVCIACLTYGSVPLPINSCESCVIMVQLTCSVNCALVKCTSTVYNVVLLT